MDTIKNIAGSVTGGAGDGGQAAVSHVSFKALSSMLSLHRSPVGQLHLLANSPRRGTMESNHKRAAV